MRRCIASRVGKAASPSRPRNMCAFIGDAVLPTLRAVRCDPGDALLTCRSRYLKEPFP